MAYTDYSFDIPTSIFDSSDAFDEDWYLEQNPDVAAHSVFGDDPYLHYTRHGKEEGRAPKGTIDWDSLMPWKSSTSTKALEAMEGYVTRLPEIAKEIPETMQGLYKTLMRQSMEGEGFQGLLNSLASRNILTSNVASDALGKQAHGISRDIANKGYESLLAGLEVELKIPSLLADLAESAQDTAIAPYEMLVSSEESKYTPYEIIADLIAELI